MQDSLSVGAQVRPDQQIDSDGGKGVFAIVVTYNRKVLLQECLAALLNQSYLPEKIIVVNNSSTDGTDEMFSDLSRFGKEADRILYYNLKVNCGGSGGFHFGLERAMELGAEACWLMDDDTIAKSGALEAILGSKKWSEPSTGCIGSLVKWTDGSLHKMNVHGNAVGLSWLGEVKSSKTVPVESLSFVSILVKRAAIAKVGLPIKDFFIWYDDVEYTQRIRKFFNIYYSLESEVVHKTVANQGAGFADYNSNNAWKYRFKVRNGLYVIRNSEQSFIKKGLRVLKNLWDVNYFVLFQKGPVKAYFWFFQGLFFNPKIDYISDDGAQ